MDVIMPQLGETVEEGTIAVWHKKPGDRVAVDDILLEIETDKVATEVPALAAGTLKQILVAEGATVKVGTVLAVIACDDADHDGKRAQETEARAHSDPARAGAPVMAGNGRGRPPRHGPGGLPLSPAVRRLIAEHGLEPTAIVGTGRNGRIQRQDVLAYLQKPKAEQPAPLDATDLVPFSALRKRIARHMAASKATSPHVTQAIEVDFHEVQRVRAVMKAAVRAKYDCALSYLPFIARAVCLALPRFPHLNAQVEGEALRLHRRINLAMAVDLDFEGLIAPVVKDANDLTVVELARRISDLAARARAHRLQPDDMTEGTYSISNNGSFGTLFTTPIINQPQVAILSTDAIARRPWVVGEEKEARIAIRPVGVLAQSFDHRAVDGAYGAAFLGEVKAILETRDWAREFI
ncbi:MAG: dihydrolipoamide acetyltransferase family protein [Pseudomonadota bacterium]